MKNNLKSPSTAKFPSKRNWKFTPIDGGYKVTAYVDSQNSFGATVRSDFGCTVTKAGEGKVNRKLDYLNTKQ
ncbi:hypothetical protein QVA66_03750 [Staphylococcus chromogenes]|nr:hypothetical protein [Staphylococcus chromogenes]